MPPKALETANQQADKARYVLCATKQNSNVRELPRNRMVKSFTKTSLGWLFLSSGLSRCVISVDFTLT